MNNSDDTGFLLHSLAAALDRQSDKVLSDFLGIRFAQFKILSVLVGQEGISQIAIARQLGQTEASVSRQVKLLQTAGLIIVKFQPNNRRQRTIGLTSTGRHRLVKACRLLNRFHAPVFGRLSDHQRRQLHENLQILHLAARRLQ